MNLRELRAAVEEKVGLADAHDGTDPGEIDDLLNEVYLDVAGAHDWPWLRQTQAVATVASDATYDLTSPVVTAEQVKLTSGGTLEPMSPYELDAIHLEDRAEEGEPRRYVWRDPDTIELYPIPDDVYLLEIDGLISPVPLSAETDVPLFADEFHRVLVYLAAAGLVNAVDSEQAGRHEVRARAIKDRMWRRYFRSADRTPMVMGGRRTHRVLERRLNGGR